MNTKNIMYEMYVTKEIAEILKKVGFPQEVTNVIYEGDRLVKRKEWHLGLFKRFGSEIIDAPTQSLASSWLRETKNIETIPIYKGPGEYMSFCSAIEEKDNQIYNSFEKAFEEGIHLACNYLWEKNI